jgi:hypothetical protein
LGAVGLFPWWAVAIFLSILEIFLRSGSAPGQIFTILNS